MNSVSSEQSRGGLQVTTAIDSISNKQNRVIVVMNSVSSEQSGGGGGATSYNCSRFNM